MATSSTDSVNASSIPIYDPTKKTTGSSKMGKDEFLKVLVAQMQHQDPLKPSSDTEWIAQLAQFSSLEQMQNMNSSIQSMTANSLVGMVVQANQRVDSDGNTYSADVVGAVVGVQKLQGTDYLVVNDLETGAEYLVPPSSVQTSLPGASTESSQLAVIAQLLQNSLTSDSSSSEQLAAIAEMLKKLLETVGTKDPGEESAAVESSLNIEV